MKDASATSEIGNFLSQNIYCQYSVHIPSERDVIFLLA